jgi:hypothetical protein
MDRVSHPDITGAFNIVLYMSILDILTVLELKICHKGKGKVPAFNQAWRIKGIAPPISISALVGGEWSTSRPGRFTPICTDMRLGGPQSRSGRSE